MIPENLVTQRENSGVMEYVHPELMIPVTAIGGNCTFTKSERLQLGEDEVFYLVGMAVFDSTCCGYGGCAYAYVPGLIRQWHFKTDADGRPVSKILPIADSGMQERIKKRIMEKECVQQVNFL
ncbi:MAG: hypothetical protein C4548_14050 [Desulfobacteraceae bacterium]|jgi:hypothetical protein|nr:MAG: hypothetical protein C4548_14050 [Desulfobacteraceae bacterium]